MSSDKESPSRFITKSTQEDDSELCYICANKIGWRIIGFCNHNACYVCILRLRALYRDNKCPFCKRELTKVIFTSDKTKSFAEINTEKFFFDDPTGVYIENREAKDAFDRLMSFTCPQKGCKFISKTGWDNIKRHCLNVHGKSLCGICLEHQNKFSSEYKIYTKEDLKKHMKLGDSDDLTIKGHPSCKFCKVRYYGNDELNRHYKEAHEECFICNKENNSSNRYKDYNSLENHFEKDHFVCHFKSCLEQKFVVFGKNQEYIEHMKNVHQVNKSNSTSGIRKEIVIPMSYTHEEGSSKRRTNSDIRHQGGGVTSDRAREMIPSSLDTSLSEPRAPLRDQMTSRGHTSQNITSTYKPVSQEDQSMSYPPLPSSSSRNLTSREVTSAAEKLNIYQKKKLEALFHPHREAVMMFLEVYASFYHRRRSARSLTQNFLELVTAAFGENDNIVMKIQEAGVFWKDISSTAGSIFKRQQIDLSSLLMDSWNMLSSEYINGLPKEKLKIPEVKRKSSENGSVPLKYSTVAKSDLFPVAPASVVSISGSSGTGSGNNLELGVKSSSNKKDKDKSFKRVVNKTKREVRGSTGLELNAASTSEFPALPLKTESPNSSSTRNMGTWPCMDARQNKKKPSPAKKKGREKVSFRP